MTQQNGNGKTAGWEEALGLDRNSSFQSPFNPIEELSKGSIKPEEWMARTEYDDREISVRNLRTRARHRCRRANTDTELTDWHKDHMKMSRGRRRMKELVTMVTGMQDLYRNRQYDSRFNQMAGGYDTQPQGNNTFRRSL